MRADNSAPYRFSFPGWGQGIHSGYPREAIAPAGVGMRGSSVADRELDAAVRRANRERTAGEQGTARVRKRLAETAPVKKADPPKGKNTKKS